MVPVVFSPRKYTRYGIKEVILKIVQENGKTNIVKLPVEIWEKSGKYTLRFHSVSPIKEVVVDPDKMLPDVNAKNNTWISGKR